MTPGSVLALTSSILSGKSWDPIDVNHSRTRSSFIKSPEIKVEPLNHRFKHVTMHTFIDEWFFMSENDKCRKCCNSKLFGRSSFCICNESKSIIVRFIINLFNILHGNEFGTNILWQQFSCNVYYLFKFFQNFLTILTRSCICQMFVQIKIMMSFPGKCLF